MSSSPTWHLGMDIGGTKCAVTLGRYTAPDIAIVAKDSFASSLTRLPLPTIAHLSELADELLAEHHLQRSDIASIGISCGGPLNSRLGMILSPPNLPGWDEVAIVAELKKTLGIKAYLENDANACALAEWRWGAGQRCDNMIFLTFGTGLGAGLILGGRLYRGTNDMAGEIGHIRMADTGPVGYNKAGSLEGFCSGGGLSSTASLIGLQLSAEEIFQKAAVGHPQCRQLVEQMGRQLARGLAILIDILNPQKIVIGSIYTRQEKVLRPLLDATLQCEALGLNLNVCEILPAQLGESIGDYAALAIARNGDWT